MVKRRMPKNKSTGPEADAHTLTLCANALMNHDPHAAELMFAARLTRCEASAAPSPRPKF
ncbi:MAG: hypothetical protein COB66_06205 [Coxiella sp. (in: Bacteria)]|nr:MAG: hypothetical protein COB66_06205 [Coxiella sp. (in: g-proteobacteria)]